MNMLLIDYPPTRGEEIPEYSKKATWNLLHAYIYVHTQRLIDECPVYGVQDISKLQPQYVKMTFDDQSI